MEFQSLFQWILLSNYRRERCRKNDNMFQSLFQWILLSNLLMLVYGITPNIVSILVLVDLAIEFSLLTLRIGQPVKFQSLFQWILLSNQKSEHPSYGGFIPFQSLFQWILLSNPCSTVNCEPVPIVSILVLVDLAIESHDTSMTNTTHLFQSLFQWILLSNPIVLQLQATNHCCFNPCFSGSCYRIRLFCVVSGFLLTFQSLFQWILLSNPSNVHPARNSQVVSILVLVDLAIESDHMIRKNAPLFWFQSLFQWILLSNPNWRLVCSTSNSLFQSLFQWILLSNWIAVRLCILHHSVSILVLVDLAIEFLTLLVM